MYDVNTLNWLHDRLKAQYPDCKVLHSGNAVTVTLLHGKAEIKPEGTVLYINNTIFDRFSSKEVREPDDLYELIEAFILQLQQLGMESGNETYIIAQSTTKAKAAKGLKLFLLGLCLVDPLFLYAAQSTQSPWWLLLFLVSPFAVWLPLRIVYKRLYHRYWVCPQCSQPLPLEQKAAFPKMKYVSTCPHCGHVLEKAPDITPILPEPKPSSKKRKPPAKLPAAPKNWPCTFAGSITAAFAAFLFPLLFVSEEPLDPVGVTVAVLLLLVLFGLGLALLLCRRTETQALRRPLVVMRERKLVAILGLIYWLLGFAAMLFAILCAGTSPFHASTVLILSLIGILILPLGVWMLLAYRNRTFLVFQDHSMLYISSFGKHRHFAPGQVASVQLTIHRSLHLLDKNKKKLAAIETNMQGSEQFIEWIESTDLTVNLTKAMDAQASREEEAQKPAQWREEFRTPLHDHLKAIRIGFIVTLVLLAAGSVLPFLLYTYLFPDFKMKHAVCLTAFSTVPFLLHYIAFAPVFSLSDPGAGATPEWKSMHIRFPLKLFALFNLLIMVQIYYGWEKFFLQIVDFGRFFLLIIVITVLLMASFWLRTPKRMRKTDEAALILLILVMVGCVLAYGFVLAISEPAEHYPAVVVDRYISSNGSVRHPPALTVQLEDGSTATLNVDKDLYDMEQSGTELVVCMKETPLGIRLARLHLA